MTGEADIIVIGHSRYHFSEELSLANEIDKSQYIATSVYSYIWNLE